MKKQKLELLLCVLLILILAGCQGRVAGGSENSEIGQMQSEKESEKDSNSSGNGEMGNNAIGTVEVTYQAQNIRTNFFEDKRRHPEIYLIRSAQELNEYYESKKDVCDLGSRDEVYVDTSIGFVDACEKYTENFFKENYLVFVVLEEGSGSISHKVESVVYAAEYSSLWLVINTFAPEEHTDDMAGWHIIVEVPREYEVAGTEYVDVSWE